MVKGPGGQGEGNGTWWSSQARPMPPSVPWHWGQGDPASAVRWRFRLWRLAETGYFLTPQRSREEAGSLMYTGASSRLRVASAVCRGGTVWEEHQASSPAGPLPCSKLTQRKPINLSPREMIVYRCMVGSSGDKEQNRSQMMISVWFVAKPPEQNGSSFFNFKIANQKTSSKWKSALVFIYWKILKFTFP